jgi:PPK2 family polyphosphate:nucleotide phosphotransferase
MSTIPAGWHYRRSIIRRQRNERSDVKIQSEQFRVKEGDRLNLAKWPTRVKPTYKSRKDYSRLLDRHVGELSERQDILYAHHHYSLLLIFQAMDAAGKDGAIKHVMSGINPQGCQVFSFKQPSAQELRHDFLWRTTRCLPERGCIGIFNRSYYEEVLIVRVHPEILRGQDLPDENLNDRKIWEHRYRSIIDLEKHLHSNGTRIAKFFLHLSKEEQRKRFLARIGDPNKNWKFSEADLAERKLWKDYQHAYEDCIAATSTVHAPWYIIPADDKENARLIISQIILDTLNGLKMKYPEVDKSSRKKLQEIRRLLVKEK